MNTLTQTKRTTSLRIDNKLFAYIEQKAKEENRSVNNYIETILLNTSGYTDPSDFVLTDKHLAILEEREKRAEYQDAEEALNELNLKYEL